MRICIFGAGAVGSHFAVRLALAGHDVACVMRGSHLDAVKADGLTLRVGDAEFSVRVKASGDPAALGPQDLVISTLKANSLDGLVDGLPPLLAENTAVVFAQNGIPWWYDIGIAADHPPPPDLSFLDPGGRLRALVSKERIMGGVSFSSNEIAAPGIVVFASPDRTRLLIGESRSSALPAPGPRPLTSRRSCRILSAAGRWKSIPWCARRRHLPGRRACRRRCSICWRGSPSGRRATTGCIRLFELAGPGVDHKPGGSAMIHDHDFVNDPAV
jgi:hypothetical protein